MDPDIWQDGNATLLLRRLLTWVSADQPLRALKAIHISHFERMALEGLLEFTVGDGIVCVIGNKVGFAYFLVGRDSQERRTMVFRVLCQKNGFV